jgi:hypothetical protein
MHALDLLNKIMEEDNYKFFDHGEEEVLGVGTYNGKVYWWRMGEDAEEEVFELK